MNNTYSQSNQLQNRRVQNSVRNVVTGIATVIFTTVMPFAIRTLMTYTVGIEYLGFNNLFVSILQILNISELGIGSVMVYFLYAPAAVGDTDKIDAYLNMLHKIYMLIGTTILVIGLSFTPFLRHFISGNIPIKANIYLYFLLYLFAYVLQYFIFPEEITLVEAFQRKDISNRILLISNGISYVIQIVVLYVYHNYEYYLFAVIIQGLLAGILRKYYGSKYYPQYELKGELNPEEKRDIKNRILSMIGHQMDEKMFNSIDTVFISSLIGLSAVAVYGNYFFIITAGTMLFDMIYTSVLSSIGNAVAVETSDRNYVRFKKMFWLGACLTGWATTCMLCLYQNFMRIWMGTDNMFGMDMVILFCVYFYLSQIRKTVVTFKNASGMWWNDRYKPYISMAVDLLLDLVLIRYIGVKGAIISSIVCVGIIEIPWETRVLFRDYFHISTKQYIIKMLTYGAVNLGIITLVYLICRFWVPETGIGSLLIRMLICCGSVTIYAAVFWRSKEFKAWRGTLKGLRK